MNAPPTRGWNSCRFWTRSILWTVVATIGAIIGSGVAGGGAVTSVVTVVGIFLVCVEAMMWTLARTFGDHT